MKRNGGGREGVGVVKECWRSADMGLRRLEDINKSCLEEFRRHWECLDNNNQQLWQCRKMERGLNKCVFDKLVSRPVIRIQALFRVDR